MAAGAAESPMWLPVGWTVHERVQKNGRKVRSYTNSETGKKFYSKSAVIHFLSMGKSDHDIPQASTRLVTWHSESEHMPLVVKSNKIPDWLPEGWIMNVKTRKTGSRVGSEYKYYIEPVSGFKFYSKVAVSRYLENAMCSSSTSNQMQRDNSMHYCHNNQLKGCQNHSNPEESNCLNTKRITWKSKQTKIRRKVVTERVEAVGLPPGWIKEIKITEGRHGIRRDPYYTDPVSGCIFRSKIDALRYLETGEMSKYVINPKKRLIGNQEWKNDEISCHNNQLEGCKIHSKPEAPKHLKIKHNGRKSKQKEISKKVVVEKAEAVGLPPGWIKEIKIKKGRHGIRRDPYYTDPVSGCIFRSKIDALRYLETGEMSKHVITPKERLIDDQESTKEGIPPPSAAKRRKLTHHATRKPLFAGDLPETKGSKKKQSAEIMIVSNHTAENVQKMHSLDNMTKRYAGIMDTSNMKNSALPRVRVSNRRGKKDFSENRSFSTDTADVLEEKSVPENGTDTLKRTMTNKDKNKEELSISCRSSKRLAGLEPELFANLDSGERALIRRGRSSKHGTTPAASMENRTDTHNKKKEVNVSSRISKRLKGLKPLLSANLDLGERALIRSARSSKREAPPAPSMENCSDMHNKKKELIVSCRTSKRLKGLKPELLANLDLGERAFIRSTRSSKHEATPAPSMDNEAPQKAKIEPETEFLIENSDYREALVEEHLQEMHPLDSMPKRCTGKREIFDMSNSPLPNPSVSDRSEEKYFAENRSFSTHATDVLEEKVMLERTDTRRRKTKQNKNKNNEGLNILGRFSKRLAGLDPEPVANFDSARGPGPMRSCRNEATPVPSINGSATPEAEPEAVLFLHRSDSKEPFVNEEASNKSKRHHTDRVAPEEQLEKLEMENKDQQETESQPLFSLADSWSDPCLEFAFKTLTGAIPIEDDLTIQDYFHQQADTSHIQTNGSLALPDFAVHCFSQSDIILPSDVGGKPTDIQQLPSQQTAVPSGNVSLPSCSTAVPSQPSLEPNKECHKNII